MTVEDDPPARRAGGQGGELRGMSQRRDLERYAGLFASRTSVMKSSAMRDLMAITERPEVISLAGGLPDTSTFPAESLAALLSKLAATDSARALQYAPTEGMAAVGEAIATVMAAEGMGVDPEHVLAPRGGRAPRRRARAPPGGRRRGPPPVGQAADPVGGRPPRGGAALSRRRAGL